MRHDLRWFGALAVCWLVSAHSFELEDAHPVVKVADEDVSSFVQLGATTGTVSLCKAGYRCPMPHLACCDGGEFCCAGECIGGHNGVPLRCGPAALSPGGPFDELAAKAAITRQAEQKEAIAKAADAADGYTPHKRLVAEQKANVQAQQAVDDIKRLADIIHASSPAFLCDSRAKQHVTCPEGTVRVKSAVYGRAAPTLCLEQGETDANVCTIDVTPQVSKFCEGKQICQMDVSAESLSVDDPCPHARKYLNLTFDCAGFPNITEHKVPEPKVDRGEFYVDRLVIVSSLSGRDLEELKDGEVYDGDVDFAHVTIRAAIYPRDSDVDEVRFDFDGIHRFTMDKKPPFILSGEDEEGHWNTLNLAKGKHTVTAVARRKDGAVSEDFTRTFYVDKPNDA